MGGAYFMKVYGEIPRTRYPICVGSFWFLHKDVFEAAGITDLSLQRCPSQPGDYYMTNNKYQHWASWIWHPAPFGIDGRGLPANTWIEVSHMAQERESGGSWFVFSSGSGIWFNTGKTIVFQDHGAAHSLFLGENWIGEGKMNKLWQRMEARDAQMSVEAAKQGYTTIQFLDHADDQWRCGSGGYNKLRPSMGIEVVGVRLHGVGACGDDPSVFRTGWNAEKPCDCDNGQPFLNCRGVGMSGSSDTVV